MISYNPVVTKQPFAVIDCSSMPTAGATKRPVRLARIRLKDAPKQLVVSPGDGNTVMIRRWLQKSQEPPPPVDSGVRLLHHS